MARFLGIDPGWRNLGYAVVEIPDELNLDWKVNVLSTGTLDPSRYACVESFSEALLRVDPDDVGWEWAFEEATIERYVTYQGVHTHESENILMLIGALRQRFYFTSGKIAMMVRAIDWKTKMTQILNRLYAFDNDSTSMDKKLSLQMAKFIVTNPEVITTDHEADAICLAAYPYVLRLSERQPIGGPVKVPSLRGKVVRSSERG